MPFVLSSFRGKLEEYMQLLVDSFNPAAAEGLMCRDTISVGWDGRYKAVAEGVGGGEAGGGGSSYT
jgi:hypothetical protein